MTSSSPTSLDPRMEYLSCRRILLFSSIGGPTVALMDKINTNTQRKWREKLSRKAILVKDILWMFLSLKPASFRMYFGQVVQLDTLMRFMVNILKQLSQKVNDCCDFMRPIKHVLMNLILIKYDKRLRFSIIYLHFIMQKPHKEIKWEYRSNPFDNILKWHLEFDLQWMQR